MKHVSILGLIALSFSTAGCEAVLLGAAIADDEPDEVLYGEDGDAFGAGEGNTDIQSAKFSGSIGDVPDISAEADATAYDDGDYASITLSTVQSEWGAMVAFDLTGPDRDLLFTPGGAITLSAQSGTYSYGCSGDEDAPYAYETGSQVSGTLTTTEADDGMLLVQFEVSFTGDDFARGSFEIEAR